MKEKYIKPQTTLEAFELSDILTESETETTTAKSGGIGDHNNDAGTI